MGREEELALLRTAFERSAAGSGGLVLVAGEPGIGKTRLCREFESRVVAHRARVLWGGSNESSGAPPYWPWLQLIRQWAHSTTFAVVGDLSDANAGELARLFPELIETSGGHTPLPTLEAASAQFRLFDALVALLSAMSARTPLVIILEDLHWADGPSVQLLQHVARALPKLRMLVIATFRDTDLSRTDPLAGALAELKRDPGFERIVLRGLSADAVRTYVRKTAGVEPSGPIVETLYERTKGNPFMLAESVALLADEGTLSGAELPTIKVPQAVKEALGHRFDRLSEGARELMLVAAVVGREFTYEELASVRSAAPVRGDHVGSYSTEVEFTGSDGFVALIEEAVRNAIIEELDSAGHYRFTHALMQETLLGELSATRRAFLHGQFGRALEAHWGNNPGQWASQLAAHFLESAALMPDHLALARRYAELAAEQAERQFAWPEAVRWYQVATEGVDEPDPKLLRALANCGARAVGAWTPGVVPPFMAAIDAYRRAGDSRGLAETVSELPLGLVLLPFAGPLLDEAINESSEVDAQTEVALRLKLCRRHMLLGESEVSTAEIERRETELLRLASHPEVSNGEALRAQVAGYRANRRTEFREAARHFAEAAAIYQRLGRPFDVCEGLNWATHRSMACGDLEQARVYAEANIELAGKYRHFSGTIASMVLWAVGAMRNKAPRAYHEPAPPPAGPIGGAWWALVGGRPADALAMLVPADRSGSDQRRLNSSSIRTAILFDASGSEAATTDFSNWAAAWRTRVGDPAERSSSFALVARALPTLGDDELCQLVYDEARHWKNWASFYTGIGVDAGRGMLALRLGLVDEARRAFEDGVEWGEREGCPIEVGRNLAGLARIALHEGNARLAGSLFDRAARLFRKLGARLYLDDVLADRAELSAHNSSVGRWDGGSHRATEDVRETTTGRGVDEEISLSQREAEVLHLLATGLRNREIAGRLVISERTVERHVSNIYRKLGVRGKAEATAWAVRSGLA